MQPRNLHRFCNKLRQQPLYACRVGLKRIRAVFCYHFGAGKSSPPEAITLFLTHRCNLSCKMCGQWGEGGITKKQSTQYIRQELGLADFTAFVDDVSHFKPNITLFGGEPLLYSGCLPLIKYIKQRKMHCLMITNGFFVEETADEIIASGLDELNVSLDGGGDLHDAIRGMPGLFNKITKGLKRLQERKSAQRAKKPLLNLQCTVTKYNYAHLEQLLEVASAVHADSLTFHNLIFLNNEILEKQKLYDALLGADSLDWQGFVFDPEIDPEVLHEKIKRITSGRYPFSVDFYPNFSLRELCEYYRNSSHTPPRRCLSPWIVAYVFPDAQVRPCLNCTYSFGNIKDSKFKDIWNGERAVRFRRLIKEKGIFPACIRCTELYRY